MGANSTDVLMQVLLRVLPTIVLLALAFVAGSDRRTREQWAQMLYQLGSIRPNQRDDPKIQNGVRTPFFILAFVFIFWPAYYYYYVTKPTEITSSLYKGVAVGNNADPGSRAGANAATNGVSGTPGAMGAPGTTGAPGTVSTNLYGTPNAMPSGATSGTPGAAPGTDTRLAPRGHTNIYGTPLP